jgi:hypothetical protein
LVAALPRWVSAFFVWIFIGQVVANAPELSVGNAPELSVGYWGSTGAVFTKRALMPLASLVELLGG